MIHVKVLLGLASISSVESQPQNGPALSLRIKVYQVRQRTAMQRRRNIPYQKAPLPQSATQLHQQILRVVAFHRFVVWSSASVGSMGLFFCLRLIRSSTQPSDVGVNKNLLFTHSKCGEHDTFMCHAPTESVCVMKHPLKTPDTS